MEFVVSIVTYNSIAYLDNLLSDLEEFVAGAGVTIVFHDNGSVDGTFEYLENCLLGGMHLIKSQNIGFGAAHNVIFNLFRADMYFLLNPDCRINGRLLEELAKYNDIDIAAPTVVGESGFPQKNYYFHHSWFKIVVYEWISFFWGDDLCRSRDVLLYEDRFEVEWLSGCALFVSRRVVDELGGFDEKIFLYAEDEEFCWRARGSGFRVEKLNVGVIVHYVGWSENWRNPKLREIMYRSHEYVYKKMNSESGFKRNMLLLANKFRYLIRGLK